MQKLIAEDDASTIEERVIDTRGDWHSGDSVAEAQAQEELSVGADPREDDPHA
jgi:hypothetical protein